MYNAGYGLLDFTHKTTGAKSPNSPPRGAPFRTKMDYNLKPCKITTGALGASGASCLARGGAVGARGNVMGWSKDAIGRMHRFNSSVMPEELDGQGMAFTLTLRTCPDNSEEWSNIRRAFLERLRRSHAIRWNWVVEMQRRAVPHLHGCVFFPERVAPLPNAIVSGWLECSAVHKTLARSQCVKPIENIAGWLDYMTKHGQRSVSHYQKQGMPEGWEKTGRLWGRGGDWPCSLKSQEATLGEFWSWRRLVRYARCVYERGWLPSLDGGRPCNKNELLAASFAALDSDSRVRVRWRGQGTSGAWVKISWVMAFALALYPRQYIRVAEDGKKYYDALPAMQTWLDNNVGYMPPEVQLLLRFQRARHALGYARRMLRCSNKRFSFMRGVRYSGRDALAIDAAARVVGKQKYPDGGCPPYCRYDDEDETDSPSAIIDGVHVVSKKETE